MSKKITVSIKREILEAIFEGARHLYPRETILMLRGKKSKDVIQINDLIIPPLATYGEGFASSLFIYYPWIFR